MRRVVPPLAATVLLGASLVLAFLAGGYYVEPQRIAGIVVWALVAVLAVLGPAPLPRSWPGWLAVGGLALVVAWTAASIAWAPLSAVATANVQRLLLYLGALLVTIGALRTRSARRAVEPALAATATVVIGHGLSGRLLPGIIHLGHSAKAHGRLEQPITYWNAEGLLAAMGFLVCARIAGDRARPRAMRIAAGAVAPLLAAGVYLSYSRGAIAVAVAGLVVLLAAAPVRAQLLAAATALVAGAAAAIASAAFPGVASLAGTASAQERDGAIALAILVVIVAAAALATVMLMRREARVADPGRVLPGARRLGLVATVAVALVAAGLVYGGLQENHPETTVGASAGRLTSISSNRYLYWKVGVRALRQNPVRGLGAGGFRVFWLKERTSRVSALDVHSLELEMAAELGLIGLAAFAVMIAGVAIAARRALRRDPALAAGWCAATLAWFLHASIDWDWQLPAVTLPAVILAGALIALSEARDEEVSAGPDRTVAGARARGSGYPGRLARGRWRGD